MVCTVTGMHERFGCILRPFGISSAGHSNKDLGFHDDIFPMAASMDPKYAFTGLTTFQAHSKTKKKFVSISLVTLITSSLGTKFFIQILRRRCYSCHKDRVEKSV